MAYNTTDQVYYLKQYSEIKDEFTEEQLVSFLEDVLEGRAKVWCILEGVNDHDSDDREARGLLPIIAYRGITRPKLWKKKNKTKQNKKNKQKKKQ